MDDHKKANGSGNVNTWLVGWDNPETGVYRPRFRPLRLKWHRLRPLHNDYTLQWWLPSTVHDHGSQHSLSDQGDCIIALPTDPVPASTPLGVHVYALHENARHQQTQHRIGTGRISLKELAEKPKVEIKVLTETGVVATVLSFDVVTPNLDVWLKLTKGDDNDDDEEQTKPDLDRHWTPLEKCKPSESFIEAKFRRRMVDTYLQKPVSVWMWQCLAGEVHTSAAFYDNALRFAQWVIGTGPLEGAHLAQVVGFFAWACRYASDESKDKGDWHECEQFAMIRDHPDGALRSGDCEDMAREMYLAYYWLCHSPNAPPALQALARSYTFYFVDAIIQVDHEYGLHQYAKLVRGKETLFLESTEHVLQGSQLGHLGYCEKIAQECLKRRHQGWPRQVRLLHTPTTLVEDLGFHKTDLLFFADALTPQLPMRSTLEYGTHPLATNIKLDPHALVAMAEPFTPEELEAKLPVVPPLRAPVRKTDWQQRLPPPGKYHSFLKLHHPGTDAALDGILTTLWPHLQSISPLLVWDPERKVYVKPTKPSTSFLVEIPVTVDQSFCILCLGWAQPLQ